MCSSGPGEGGQLESDGFICRSVCGSRVSGSEGVMSVMVSEGKEVMWVLTSRSKQFMVMDMRAMEHLFSNGPTSEKNYK